MFKLENIIKGILLTIFGFAVMSLSVYGWWNEMLSDVKALVALCIGFALAFMERIAHGSHLQIQLPYSSVQKQLKILQAEHLK